MGLYQRRPTVVDAVQFTDWDNPPRGVTVRYAPGGRYAYVQTVQGAYISVLPGEWIIADAYGNHFYPVDDDVFRSLYTPLENAPET